MFYKAGSRHQFQKSAPTLRSGGPAGERGEPGGDAWRRLPCIERGIPLPSSRACVLCCGRADIDTYADVCDRVEELAIRTGRSFCDCAVEFGDHILGQLAVRQSGR